MATGFAQLAGALRDRGRARGARRSSLTRSKLFCGCANRFGAPPNTLVCPVCLGLPGALPVLNRHAVTLALRAALALGCRVNETSVFERKNYFYPDLPKGYQISQYATPLAVHGSLGIAAAGGEQRVRIARLHMEEDAGKLLHEGFAWSDEKSGVDLNRAGVPLVEIVSEPELAGPEEAHAYLTALRAVLLYAGGLGRQHGGRVAALRRQRLRAADGASRRSARATEIKNLNSFRHVARAIEHEVARQVALARVRPRGRAGDAAVERRARRDRPDALQGGRARLPLLPGARPAAARRRRRVARRGARARSPSCRPTGGGASCAEYALPEYDAGVLTQERELADYFEAAARESGQRRSWRRTGS